MENALPFKVTVTTLSSAKRRYVLFVEMNENGLFIQMSKREGAGCWVCSIQVIWNLERRSLTFSPGIIVFDKRLLLTNYFFLLFLDIL